MPPAKTKNWSDPEMDEIADNMPDKLAACAFALFSQRGIGRVRMDDIAGSAGVTKGSLYWHYRSKDEVIHAACRHYYQSWTR
ncbi:MAG: TetR/AcrR family transcriptional regulator [Luteolibacter sp.]